MRGGDGDDDDNSNTIRPDDIELYPDVRAVSPEMLVYSSDIAEKKVREGLPDNHPAKLPSDPVPESVVKETKSKSMLEELTHKRNLKKIIPKESEYPPVLGKIVDNPKVENVASSSKVELDKPVKTESLNTTLKEKLSERFDKMNKDSDNDHNDKDEDWSDIKRKGKEIKKTKFLDSISLDKKSEDTPDEISSILNPIIEKFPNLSEKTLERLSQARNNEERIAIVDSLPDHELVPASEHFKTLIEKSHKKGGFENLSTEEQIEIEKVMSKFNTESFMNNVNPEVMKMDSFYELLNITIDNRVDSLMKERPGIRKHQALEIIVEETPTYRDQLLNYMATVFHKNIDKIKSRLNTEQIKKLDDAILKEDLKDLETLSENRSVKTIKSLKRINKSHSSFLDEIKSKTEEIDPNKRKEMVGSTIQIDETMDLFN